MAQSMTEATNKVNQGMKNAERAVADTVNGAPKAFEQISRDLGHQAGQMAAQVGDTVSEYYSSGREYVKTNPLAGVAMAAAAGMVAGSLITLAMRSPSRH